jgi:hypothetical protein
MTNKLYFYSFLANYEDQIALGRTPMLKIGETTQDSAEVRIHQQMGTATAQKPTIYGEFNVSFTDKQFHTFLRSRGYSQTDGAGTEWFLISAPEAEILVNEYAALVEGVATPIRQELSSRPYQHAFVRKFMATAGDFCLFAKCRSGKSAMTLLAATEAGYKSLVVVSYRTSAGNSWLQDAKTYTVFHEWDVINLSESGWADKVKVSQVAGRRQLLVSTVQRQSEKLGYSRELKKLYPAGVDLLALDECHIGGESDEFNRLKNSVSHKRLLEISGTAYKTIWKYPRENVFVWGYVEEQRAKAEGFEWAQVLPKMQLVFAKYDAAELSSVYGSDPDALKNVFSVVEGKWQDSASIQAFLRKFFAYGAMCKKQAQMLHGSQHIVMSLPSVEACYLFAKSLKEFGSQFVPLVITGDSGNSQAEILEHVRSNAATICLTRWANVVGVTVPEWDTVIHGCEYQSAEFWVQFAFRGGSTRRESWKVIDFAPERAVHSIVEMASVTATVSAEEDAAGVLRTFVDFADVFEFADGFRELNYEGILQFGDVATASAKAITNAAVSATRVGSNLQALAWAFSDLNKIANKEQLREILSENGTEGSSNAQNSVARGVTDEAKKLASQTLARVKAAVEQIDDVVVHGLLRGQHLSTLPTLLGYDRFEVVTGCHPDLFEAAIEAGWINERVVSNSVTQVHIILDAQLAAVL